MVLCRPISKIFLKNIQDLHSSKNSFLFIKHGIKKLSYCSKEYDDNKNPAPYFLNKNIQELLWGLTRVNPQKVFQKRRLGQRLEDLQIEFLTDQQLQAKFKEMEEKAKHLLQIPPIVPARKPKNKIISKDPALKGLETSKFVFTDITFGVKNSDRFIVVREPDGNLREADWPQRDRINQLYFPIQHREIKIPKLFEDDNLEDVLNRQEYEYILDRACMQFDPSDALYQKVVSITYQHLNDTGVFDKLRSTRHFGGLVFFLAWNKMIDNLLLELIETCHLEEAEKLIQIYSIMHEVKLDNKEITEVVEEFIQKYGAKKSDLELAMQATKDVLRQNEIVEKGIKKAHGHV